MSLSPSLQHWREDLVELEMVKEKNVKRWVLVGAVIVVLLAIALTSTRDFNSKLNLALFFKNPSSCQCPQDSKKYSGIVEDCCCDYETVDSVNAEVLHPLLQEIVKTPFFRYFKAKLWCDCPFWTEDGMCLLHDCSICECPENEFPEPFKRPFHRGLPSDSLVCQDDKLQGSVDRTLDSRAFRGWIETDNPWTNDDETDNDEMTYVNLLLNPERYTGYTGPSARRIWDAVYSENCPKYSSQDICQEQRVLYKLISGLHSSISIHIAADYLLDKITNLAADYLEQAEYDTGNHEEDLRTESLMRQLLYNPKLQAACPLPFDEAKLWKGQSGPQLKQQIQKKFRNISALMDCVGCEKCRLWGKLQVLGLGTALKILFSVDGKNHQDQPLQLQRNEVIALVNLLNRLSESVKYACQSGHSIKKVAEGGRVVEPYSIQTISTLQRIWEAVIPIRLRLGMLAL
ncbi:endoplasmic reticulum oxidoreductin-1-like isoform X2 [Rosa rugosa]|uniref:endoplasmic reticulum oxidoreductin-1-like isoform X2 n=1 Tax=Rosa rugosa TaxID=74645 RepID=UPI002B401C58|nr:endoplasmic reticulum oxidoreductin-1-like isoform X2 [Rosa rugosa]